MEAETIEPHQTSKAQNQNTGTDRHGPTIISLDISSGACGAEMVGLVLGLLVVCT